MSIFVECDSCGKKYRVSDDRAGTKLECKNCFVDVRVPSARKGGRRPAPTSSSSPNGLVIGLLASIVVLLVVLIGVMFFREGGDSPEIVESPPASAIERNSTTLPDRPTPQPSVAIADRTSTQESNPVQNTGTTAAQPVSRGPRRVTSTVATETASNPAEQIPVSRAAPRRVNANSSVAALSQSDKLERFRH